MWLSKDCPLSLPNTRFAQAAGDSAMLGAGNYFGVGPFKSPPEENDLLSCSNSYPMGNSSCIPVSVSLSVSTSSSLLPVSIHSLPFATLIFMKRLIP
jgi:hypothetical protein